MVCLLQEGAAFGGQTFSNLRFDKRLLLVDGPRVLFWQMRSESVEFGGELLGTFASPLRVATDSTTLSTEGLGSAAGMGKTRYHWVYRSPVTE